MLSRVQQSSIKWSSFTSKNWWTQRRSEEPGKNYQNLRWENQELRKIITIINWKFQLILSELKKRSEW